MRAALDWLSAGLLPYDHTGKRTIDEMLTVFGYARARYGCDQFVIDRLMRLGVWRATTTTRRKAVIFKLVEWAMASKVHVHLVAHARKGERDRGVPETGDIKGAMEIGRRAHLAGNDTREGTASGAIGRSSPSKVLRRNLPERKHVLTPCHIGRSYMKRFTVVAATALSVVFGAQALAQTVTFEIAPEQRTKIREYVVKEKVAPVTVTEQIAVGTALPGGVELRAVPSDWGPSVTKYQYVYHNNRVVLVEPSNRRVIQIIE